MADIQKQNKIITTLLILFFILCGVYIAQQSYKIGFHKACTDIGLDVIINQNREMSCGVFEYEMDKHHNISLDFLQGKTLD